MFIGIGELLLLWIVSSVLIGFFCMGMADAKGRGPLLWLFLGWACGWIALIALAGMPVVAKPGVPNQSSDGAGA